MENSETLTWLLFAKECKYITTEIFDKLEKENMEIGKLLNYMINNPEKYKEFDFNQYMFKDSMLSMLKNKETLKGYLRDLDKLNNILNHFECKNKNLPFEFYYKLISYSRKWFENESEINLKYVIGDSDFLREETEKETETQQETEIKIKKCRIKKEKHNKIILLS